MPTDERTQRSLGSVTIQDGSWEGKQIVPRGYVRTSTREQVETGDGAVGYGYFWWTREVEGYRAFFAAGYDGQRIYVIPELDLVAVIVAEEPGRVGIASEDTDLLIDYDVVPAVEDE
jgi:CubicO group peptidase (beta-lactamase class C family)